MSPTEKIGATEAAHHLFNALENGETLPDEMRQRLLQLLMEQTESRSAETESTSIAQVAVAIQGYVDSGEGRGDVFSICSDHSINRNDPATAEATISYVIDRAHDAALHALLKMLKFLNEFSHDIGGGVDALHRPSSQLLKALDLALVKRLEAEEFTINNATIYIALCKKVVLFLFDQSSVLAKIDRQIAGARRLAKGGQRTLETAYSMTGEGGETPNLNTDLEQVKGIMANGLAKQKEWLIEKMS